MGNAWSAAAESTQWMCHAAGHHARMNVDRVRGVFLWGHLGTQPGAAADICRIAVCNRGFLSE
jgi:hypothetical protein